MIKMLVLLIGFWYIFSIEDFSLVSKLLSYLFINLFFLLNYPSLESSFLFTTFKYSIC